MNKVMILTLSVIFAAIFGQSSVYAMEKNAKQFEQQLIRGNQKTELQTKNQKRREKKQQQKKKTTTKEKNNNKRKKQHRKTITLNQKRT